MKNKIKQLSKIVMILEENKKNEMTNLRFMQQAIDKKQEALNRITSYRDDYKNDHFALMSQSMPALMKNKLAFLEKLNVAIISERNNLELIETDKKIVFDRIDHLNNKINAINIQIEAANRAMKVTLENKEASEIDDLMVKTKLRGI